MSSAGGATTLGGSVGLGGTSGSAGTENGGTSSGGTTLGGSGGVEIGGNAGAASVAGTAGSVGGNDGAGGSAGAGGVAGSGAVGGSGGSFELDCGPNSLVLEAHGPPENRINYVIVGDGYSETDLDTVYPQHLDAMLNGDDDTPGRFAPELEPYLTYRRFINICAVKLASNTSGIPEGRDDTYRVGCPDLSDTALDGCGNDDTRLGYFSQSKLNEAVAANIPSEIEVDWLAVMLNTNEWWNSGANPMVWSGGNPDASLGAQHEGGHGYFFLGDEYGTCPGDRVNVTNNPATTQGKWEHYLGEVQDIYPDVGAEEGSGEQGAFACEGNAAYRPSDQSVMNLLWDSAYHNSISLENAVLSIYDIVDPIDSHTPESTTSVGVLEARVIDPQVIKLEWSVDDQVLEGATGQTLDVAAQGLSSGAHTVQVRAYDDTPWVPMDSPHDRSELEQTVAWTINVP